MLTAEFFDLRPRRNPFVGKSEVVFDRVDAVDQAGANDERRLDPEYRITSQILSPSRKRCVTRVRYPGALIIK